MFDESLSDRLLLGFFQLSMSSLLLDLLYMYDRRFDRVHKLQAFQLFQPDSRHLHSIHLLFDRKLSWVLRAED
jgi:hypothetical protein